VEARTTGGFTVDSHAIPSTPNHPSTVLASPNRTPLKIDSRQISDATTYEAAVGRKNTDRKNARATFTWLTSNASASDSTNVSGTMNTAKIVNVPRLDKKLWSDSMSM
jgi:hypothetical protein